MPSFYGEVPQFHFTAEVKLNLGDYQSSSVSFGLSRVPIDVTPEQFEEMLDGVVVDMLGRVHKRVQDVVVERLRTVLGPYASNHEIVKRWGEEAVGSARATPPPPPADPGSEPPPSDLLTDRQRNMIGALLKELGAEASVGEKALMRLLADGGHIQEGQVALMQIGDFGKKLASTAIDVLKASTWADVADAANRAQKTCQGAFA